MQGGPATVLDPAPHLERTLTPMTIGGEDLHLPKQILATLLADPPLVYILTVSVSRVLVVHLHMGLGRILAEILRPSVPTLGMHLKARTTTKQMESPFSLLLDQLPPEIIHMIALRLVVHPVLSVKDRLLLVLQAPSLLTAEPAPGSRLPQPPEVASMDLVETMARRILFEEEAASPTVHQQRRDLPLIKIAHLRRRHQDLEREVSELEGEIMEVASAVVSAVVQRPPFHFVGVAIAPAQPTPGLNDSTLSSSICPRQRQSFLAASCCPQVSARIRRIN
jgi:hypothetical protein